MFKFEGWHDFQRFNKMTDEELERIVIEATDLYHDTDNQKAIAALFLLYKRLQSLNQKVNNDG